MRCLNIDHEALHILKRYAFLKVFTSLKHMQHIETHKKCMAKHSSKDRWA